MNPGYPKDPNFFLDRQIHPDPKVIGPHPDPSLIGVVQGPVQLGPVQIGPGNVLPGQHISLNPFGSNVAGK